MTCQDAASVGPTPTTGTEMTAAIKTPIPEPSVNKTATFNAFAGRQKKQPTQKTNTTIPAEAKPAIIAENSGPMAI